MIHRLWIKRGPLSFSIQKKKVLCGMYFRMQYKEDVVQALTGTAIHSL